MSTWAIVLVKDFGTAKQRLGPALDPRARRALARRNAERAIRASAAADHRVVVAANAESACRGEECEGVELKLIEREWLRD